MDRLAVSGLNGGMATTHPSTSASELRSVDFALVTKAIASRSFCTLATTSPTHRPHVAGVLYEAVGTTLYVNTMRTSRKARNIAANGRASVCIFVRRLPVGPPSSVQLAASAAVVDLDDPEILSLLGDGKLKSITGHGELDLADGCFLRISPGGRIFTYGLGMPLWTLVRDPLHAAGVVDLPA